MGKLQNEFHNGISRFRYVILLLISMISGGAFGVLFKDTALQLIYIGELYFSLLQIAVTPIVILLIIIGTIDFAQVRASAIVRIFCNVTVIITFTCIVAIFSANIFGVYSNDENKRQIEAELFFNNDKLNMLEISVDTSLPEKLRSTPQIRTEEVLLSFIPKNIFSSLTSANMIQIIIISALVGAGINAVSSQQNNIRAVKKNLEFFLSAFNEVNNKIVNIMPVGVFFIISNQFCKLDFGIIYLLSKLIFSVLFCIFALMIIYSAVIIFVSKKTISEFLSIFSNSFIIMFATVSSIVALPSAVQNLKILKADEAVVDLYMPFGVSLFRFGTICFFLISSLFFVSLFGTKIHLSTIFMLSIYSIFAAIGTTGAVSFVAVQMISIPLAPYGIEPSIVIPALIVLDAIVDIPVTFVNVLGNASVVMCSSGANNIKSYD